MKRLISYTCIVFFSCTAIYKSAAQDSTVVLFNGTIVDASSQEPVDAKIKYESLPYGSKIGVFSGNTCTFNLEDNKDYMIVVKADGYTTYSTTIKYNEVQEGKIDKLIELNPNGINRLIRLDKLIFALGKANISPESHTELDQIVNMLEESVTMTIQLEGHTDFRGNAKENLKLSQKRVDAVKDYIVKQGISKKRINTLAFGGNQPLSRDNGAEARAANRRVEVRILTN